MTGLTELIIIAGLIAIVFAGFILAWYLIRTIRIKEKSLLIEKGVDMKYINSGIEKKNYFSWLRIGILLSGIALGTLLVAFLMQGQGIQISNRSSGFSFGVILLFAGLSMILANFVGGSKEKK